MANEGLFQQVIDETNLRIAWIKARYYASTSVEYFDKYAYDGFAEELDANLAVLRNALISQEFRFGSLRVFEIPKADNTRKLYVASPHDSVVIQAIINIVGPIFEHDFSELCFGHRLNLDKSESKAPFKDWSDQYNDYLDHAIAILAEPSGTWYEISDIADFYPSVDLTILKSIVSDRIEDAQILTLIDQLLNVTAINLNEELEDVPGLPPGTFHAHFFANVYLDSLDKFMEARTLKYARYVDDFCFACASHQELLALEKELIRYLKHELGGLRLNPKKTEQATLANWQPLITHTRKLKYDLRFGVIEVIDIVELAREEETYNAKRKAEALFRDLFLTVEKEEDISRIAQESAGFIGRRLPRLFISEEQAIAIAYGLLETNPPRTSAIRALLGCLMELSLDRPPERLIEFIRSSPSITKITFLQLLPGFAPVHEKIIRLLVDDLRADPNYLVRANVYSVLKALDHQLELEAFRRFREDEDSEYVLAHLVGCLTLVPDEPYQPMWPEIRVILTIDSDVVLNATLRTLDELLKARTIAQDSLQMIFPSILHNPLDVFSSILVLRLACRYGTGSMLEAAMTELRRHGDELSLKLIRVISSRTFQFFVQRQELDSLFRLSDSLAEAGAIFEALVGYQELVTKSGDKELQRRARRSRDRLGHSWPLPELPSWYKLDGCDEGLYCELTGETEYTARYFNDKLNGRRGTLEIITIERVIASDDFRTADTWLSYLRYLDKEDVVSVLDLGILSGEDTLKVFALYQIPPGFQTLQEWLAQDRLPSDEESVLEITSMIISLLEKTQLQTGFQFQSINPCNILWNPAGEMRFINIGSSLGAPKYVCGIGDCRVPAYQDEVGVTTGSYYMGLLLLQLLCNCCPLEILAQTDSAYGKSSSLAECLDKFELSPHFRCVLLRMLQRYPDYRYPNLPVLAEDLEHILRFRAHYDRLVSRWQGQRDKELLTKLTLVDYVTFRLNVIRRSPKLSHVSSVSKVNHILERLSDDLLLYDPEGLTSWKTRVSWWKNRDKLPRLPIWRWLSPEARQLMGTAQGWAQLIQEVRRDCQVQYDDAVSPLLLARTIHTEALAAMQGVFMASRGLVDSLEEHRALIYGLRAMSVEELAKLRLRYRPDAMSDPVANPYTHEHLQDSLEILQAALEREWPHFSARVSSLTALLSVVALFGFEYEFVDPQGRTVAASMPILRLGHPKKLTPDIWMTTKLPAIIDDELELITNTRRAVPGTDWWQVTRRLLEFLHILNPCRRIRGKLIWYQALASPSEGKVLIGWLPPPWPVAKRDFSQLVVFTSGDLLIARGAQRSVQVDVWHTDEGQKPSSILARSNLFSSLEAFCARTVSAASMAHWMRQRKGIVVRIVIFGVAIALYVLSSTGDKPTDDWIEKLIPMSSLAQVLRFGLWMMSAVIGNALWDVVKEFLSVNSPEDSRIVESIH